MQQDRGMTVLEVVVAMAILMLGVVFITRGDAVAYKYRARHELRQQMLFYAAGQLEAVLQNQSLPPETQLPFSTFSASAQVTPVPGINRLEQVKLVVTCPSVPDGQVELYTYRVGSGS